MGGFVEMWVLMCRCTFKFDAILQWPAKVIITLQLFNQHRDKEVTKRFLWKRPEREREYVGIGYFTHSLPTLI